MRQAVNKQYKGMGVASQKMLTFQRIFASGIIACMSLSLKEVEHIAELARLELSETEKSNTANSFPPSWIMPNACRKWILNPSLPLRVYCL